MIDSSDMPDKYTLFTVDKTRIMHIRRIHRPQVIFLSVPGNYTNIII